ncbi:MAG TPA: Trm112 family protein [Thermoplasmata archaeon]|jgi:uncharacterized protein YbaR (Trm112 family)|nr:Trm112 family protein [Thermoplasmata archaeon]
MKKEIIKILCCPTCKGTLVLSVEREEKEEIISGSFSCAHCHCTYPIIDGIPDLLPRETEGP